MQSKPWSTRVCYVLMRRYAGSIPQEYIITNIDKHCTPMLEVSMKWYTDISMWKCIGNSRQVLTFRSSILYDVCTNICTPVCHKLHAKMTVGVKFWKWRIWNICITKIVSRCICVRLKTCSVPLHTAHKLTSFDTYVYWLHYHVP